MISLGQSTVSLELREIFSAGVALRIGARAFDILELLIQRQGRLVTKDEILERVWPQTVVEENNLQVHISALRKALGRDRDVIRTIPGRGYLLILDEGSDANASSRAHSSAASDPDTFNSMASALPATPNLRGFATQLPPQITLIGRDRLLVEVDQALKGSSLVTLTGAGGIGKTALATEIAHRWAADVTRRVLFVSLADLLQPDAVPRAIAQALDIEAHGSENLLQGVIHELQRQPTLMILDNCEHLIGAVAALAGQLLAHCESLRLLATSRESLRIAAERSLRLPALAVPAAGAERSDIMQSPAVQLFMRHLRAMDGCLVHGEGVELDDQSIELVSVACRRVEGLPLALEMAAARACALGLFDLVTNLGESIHMLSAGLRTAPERHQSLRASLDWSLRLLDTDERRVLEHLSEMPGRFTLDVACDALQHHDIRRSRVLECIVGLAVKSLLSVTAAGPFRFYELPEWTRACLVRKALAPQEPRASLGNTSGLSARERELLGSRPLSMMAVRRIEPVPERSSGYHASHQRMLAACQ